MFYLSMDALMWIIQYFFCILIETDKLVPFWYVITAFAIYRATNYKNYCHLYAGVYIYNFLENSL